jgi:iron complex outermembrane receptor protein
MNKLLKRAMLATTALAGGMLVSGVAMAQSSGTAAVEELVVTGARGPADISGVIVAETEPKSASPSIRNSSPARPRASRFSAR